MNSKRKGKRGELELASYMRDQGWDARRGQQFSGTPDSPDVVTTFPMHLECKRTERLNLRDAVAQAEGDCGGKPWAVCHRWNDGQWLAIVKLETLCELVRQSAAPSPQK